VLTPLELIDRIADLVTAHALARHVDQRYGTATHKWMTQCKSSQTGEPTAIWQHKWYPTLTPISASIDE
jgi:hypothetical protein